MCNGESPSAFVMFRSIFLPSSCLSSISILLQSPTFAAACNASVTSAFPSRRKRPATLLHLPRTATLQIFSIPGYSLYNNFDDSMSNKPRGIIIYVRNYLPTERIVITDIPFEEQLWLKIYLSHQDALLCGCIYRSPSASKSISTNNLCDLLTSVANKKASHLLIMGDFNYGQVDWSNHSVTDGDCWSQKFLDTCQDCFFYQHVLSPTHYRCGQHPSLLDLILTNEEGMVSELQYLPSLDHPAMLAL